MSGLAQLVETVELIIERADAADHRRMLLGVTDLLVDSSANLSDDHVYAFDAVIGRLIGKAETEARQAVAERVVTLRAHTWPCSTAIVIISRSGTGSRSPSEPR